MALFAKVLFFIRQFRLAPVVSFFLSLFFDRYTLRSPNGTQPDFATCLEVSQILKCTSKIWESLSLKFGAKNLTLFRHLFDNFVT